MELLLEKDCSYDLLSGNAGAIMAYLNAFEITGRRRYLKTAVRAGEYLIARAVKGDFGWCWKDLSSEKGLTGMAHGSAGIMMALARLGFFKKDERFTEAARQAVKYEDSFYSDRHKDWMDLRFVDHSDRVCEVKQKTSGVAIADEENNRGWLNVNHPAWCHGKAGILLSRGCSRKYMYEETLNVPKEISVKTEIDRNNDFTLNLCHGLSGVAAIKQIMGEDGEGMMKKS